MELCSSPLSVVDKLYDLAGRPSAAKTKDWGVQERFDRAMKAGLQVWQHTDDLGFLAGEIDIRAGARVSQVPAAGAAAVGPRSPKWVVQICRHGEVLLAT